jgi:hypothetical protein
VSGRKALQSDNRKGFYMPWKAREGNSVKIIKCETCGSSNVWVEIVNPPPNCIKVLVACNEDACKEKSKKEDYQMPEQDFPRGAEIIFFM